MRPLDAVVRVSQAREGGPDADLSLSCCETCRDAMLGDLASMFRPGPVEETHRVSLENSLVCGVRWRVGPVEACALHPYLHGDAAHG